MLQSGQLITGRKTLSDETGINESTIERALSYFEKEGQIEQRKSSTSRLISITNWSKWQQGEQRMNNERTTDEQRMNTKQDITNTIDNIYCQDSEKLVQFINETFSKRYKHSDKIVSHFKARLTKDKYTKQEIFEVIKALKETQYHKDTNFKYCTPEFILRQSTIEKYKHGAINQQPTNQPKSNSNIMDDFYGD
jgi:DNA-binding transcriptional regulator YhcF (GntR family)